MTRIDSPAALAVLAAVPWLEPRPAHPVLAALDNADVYKTYLAGWWLEHGRWRAAFPPASVLELQKLHVPDTPKKRGIPYPSEEQLAAYAEALAGHADAHCVWKPVNAERKKAAKNAAQAVRREEQDCT